MRRQLHLALAVFACASVGFLQSGILAESAWAATPRSNSAGCVQGGSVSYGLWQVTTGGCLSEVGTGDWTTSDPVTLNGVSLTPAPGTQLEVRKNPSDNGAVLTVNAALTISGVTFEKQGLLRFDLPSGAPGEEKTVLSTGALNGQSLFDLPISGSFEIRIGRDTKDIPYVKFIGNLELPTIFKNGPEQGAGGLTANVGLRVDRDGVHADAIKAEVSNAYIGSLQVKNLCLSYVSAGSTLAPCNPPKFGAEPFLDCPSEGNADRWDGTAQIVIPTKDRPEVGVWAGVRNGQFSYAGGQVTHLGNAAPIATGVYLDSVALAVCVNPPPIVFKGGAGINIGPTTNGVAPVHIDGSVKYTDSRPWVLEVGGSLDVFGNRVADGFVKYQSDNTIDFGFNLNIDVKIASVEAHLLGWIEARNPLRFNVDGSGKLCVIGICMSGEVTASSDGLAACITIGEGDVWELVYDPGAQWWEFWRTHWQLRHWRWRAGFGARWGGEANLMGDECDVGPYRAARSARVSAAGEQVLNVAAGQTGLVLKIQGTHRAPRVELIAPDGATYTSPSARAKLERNRDMFIEDPRANTTNVAIAQPAAGRWRIRALTGDAIVGLEQATVEPMATLHVNVDGSGEHRILGYEHQPQPDHSTRFVEVGGNYEQELGAAEGHPCKGIKPLHPDRPLCGEIHFTPAPGPAGTRHIYAVTTMNGVETRRELVATYEAPPRPEPPEVPSEIVHRVPGGLSVGWGASREQISVDRPVDYDVDVNLSDGRKLLLVLRKGDDHVTVPDVGPDVAADVKVSPVRDDDTLGKTREVTLTPGATAAASKG